MAEVRHCCALTGSEMVGDSDGEESEASMEHSGTNKGGSKKKKKKAGEKGSRGLKGERPMEAQKRQKRKNEESNIVSNASGSLEVKSAEEGQDKMQGEHGVEEQHKVILKFREEGGVGVMSPIRLMSVIKELIGEVVNANVLRDGNLLVCCKDMAQRENAFRVKQIGKCKGLWSNWIDQSGSSGLKG